MEKSYLPLLFVRHFYSKLFYTTKILFDDNLCEVILFIATFVQTILLNWFLQNPFLKIPLRAIHHGEHST